MRINMKNSRCRKIPALVLGIMVGLFAPSTLAVEHEGLFELDGNAVATGVPGDDWSVLYGGGGSHNAFTGILHDEPNASGVDSSIFTGGRKDIQDIDQWAHKMGSSPDKDELTHAYAAAYNNSAGDLIVYFGADRISNKGDAFMGFWFFKQSIEAKADGSFTGAHTAGDVLVLANYPQSQGAVPEVRVALWDTSCNKAANNDPIAGECAAKNIRLKFKGAAVCDGVSNADVCAITNRESGVNNPTPSPWPYQSKNSDTANEFPYETFMEGGINLTKLVGSDSCFSSFMAESRSSSSFTSTLKDFVLDKFELCSIDISKTCSQARVNPTETGYEYDFEGVVTNDGAGSLYNVLVTDNEANQTFPLGTILKGDTAIYDGTFESTDNGTQNTVTVTASATPNGASTVTDNTGADCEGISLSPMIEVSKECTSSFEATANGIIAKVDFSGQVCNTTPDDLTLINVSVRDDSGTPGDISDDVTVLSGVTLAGGACEPYSGSYTPLVFGNPTDQTFSDTVTAAGVLKIDSSLATDTASATCPICPSSE
jgi:hypothetical protein